MGIGTFGSFTQSRLAIYAAQAAITVSGNNVANINTLGYTRQKLDQSSMYIGGTDRYYSSSNLRIGGGVLCDGVSQIRDKYLDIRYRNEMASVGGKDTWLAGLDGIAAILDEVGDGKITAGEDFGVISAELDELYKAISGLTDQTSQETYDKQVNSACTNLAATLRSYASRLEKYYNETMSQFKQDLQTVNGLLTDIRNLNESIRTADLYGDKALEMRDERNVKLDKLSEYMKINVTYTVENIGPGQSIEKMILKLGDANPDPSVTSDETVLIDGIYGSQISIIQNPVLNPEHDVTKEEFVYTDLQGRKAYTDKLTAIKDNEAIEKLIQKEGLTVPAGCDSVILDAKGEHILGFADSTDPAVKNGDYDVNNPPKYLKPDETPTNDINEALMEDNPNLNLSISDLRDAKNHLLVYTSKEAPEVISRKEFEAAYVANGNKYSSMTDGKDGISTVVTTYWRTSQTVSLKPKYVEDPNEDDGIAKDPDGNPVVDYYFFELDGKEIKIDSRTVKDADGNDVTEYFYEDPEGLEVIVSDLNYASHKAPVYTYHKQVHTQTPSQKVDLDDNDLTGRIQSYRELLTEKGEYTSKSMINGMGEDGNPLSAADLLSCDENAGTKRGIPYYMNTLDLLANRIAYAFNNANQGYRTDPDGNLVTMTWDAKANENQGGLVGVPTQIEYTDGAATKTFTFSTKNMLDNTTWNMDPNTGGIPQGVQDAIKAELAKDPNYEFAPDGKLTSDDVKAYLSLEHTVYELDKDGNQVLDQNGNPIPILDEDGNEVKTSNAFFVGAPMFSNHGSSNDTTGITAGNISVSAKWQSGAILVGSFICPPGDYQPASTDSDNLIKNMTSLFYQDQKFYPDTLKDDAAHEVMFNGTFREFWINIGTVMGNDQSVTNSALDNHYATSIEIDTSRDSVSAVDFNDEASNLFMYSKAYNAACRVMTTLDTILDKLINGTGMTT